MIFDSWREEDSDYSPAYKVNPIAYAFFWARWKYYAMKRYIYSYIPKIKCKMGYHQTYQEVSVYLQTKDGKGSHKTYRRSKSHCVRCNKRVNPALIGEDFWQPRQLTHYKMIKAEE